MYEHNYEHRQWKPLCPWKGIGRPIITCILTLQEVDTLPIMASQGVTCVTLSAKTSLGALDGGPLCRLSILRKGNVPCRYFRHFPVDFKIVQCRISNLRSVPCHVINVFSNVDRLHVACGFYEMTMSPCQNEGSRAPALCSSSIYLVLTIYV